MHVGIMNNTKDTPPKRHKVEKVSHGVSCFDAQDELRVLMVCKRFTYAFSNFVNGIYLSRNDDSVRALFNKMTIEEHLDILSLNFQQRIL